MLNLFMFFKMAIKIPENALKGKVGGNTSIFLGLNYLLRAQ